VCILLSSAIRSRPYVYCAQSIMLFQMVVLMILLTAEADLKMGVCPTVGNRKCTGLVSLMNEGLMIATRPIRSVGRRVPIDWLSLFDVQTTLKTARLGSVAPRLSY
jgi:hypothetical protein